MTESEINALRYAIDNFFESLAELQDEAKKVIEELNPSLHAGIVTPVKMQDDKTMKNAEVKKSLARFWLEATTGYRASIDEGNVELMKYIRKNEANINNIISISIQGQAKGKKVPCRRAAVQAALYEAYLKGTPIEVLSVFAYMVNTGEYNWENESFRYAKAVRDEVLQGRTRYRSDKMNIFRIALRSVIAFAEKESERKYYD